MHTRIAKLIRRKALAGLLVVLAAPQIGSAGNPSPAGVARISDAGVRPASQAVEPTGYRRALNSDVSCDMTGMDSQCYPEDGTNADGSGRGRGCRNRNGRRWGGITNIRPPLGVPISRNDNIYQKYWPDGWTGQSAGVSGMQVPCYPMVYQPTDTAQLGYYSTRVPYWYSQPNRLPPAPLPNWGANMGNSRGYYAASNTPMSPTPVPNNSIQEPAPAPIQVPNPAAEAKIGIQPRN